MAAERSHEEALVVRTCLGMRWSFMKEMGLSKLIGDAAAKLLRAAMMRRDDRILMRWVEVQGGRLGGWARRSRLEATKERRPSWMRCLRLSECRPLKEGLLDGWNDRRIQHSHGEEMGCYISWCPVPANWRLLAVQRGCRYFEAASTAQTA